MIGFNIRAFQARVGGHLAKFSRWTGHGRHSIGSEFDFKETSPMIGFNTLETLLPAKGKVNLPLHQWTEGKNCWTQREGQKHPQEHPGRWSCKTAQKAQQKTLFHSRFTCVLHGYFFWCKKRKKYQGGSKLCFLETALYSNFLGNYWCNHLHHHRHHQVRFGVHGTGVLERAGVELSWLNMLRLDASQPFQASKSYHTEHQ